MCAHSMNWMGWTRPSISSSAARRFRPFLLSVLIALLALPHQQMQVFGWTQRRASLASHWRRRTFHSSSSLCAKTLVVVESPAKAKTIQKFLQEMESPPGRERDEFVVDYCAGHINDLSSSAAAAPAQYHGKILHPLLPVKLGELGVDVHDNFSPIYVTAAGKEEIVRRLRVTAKTVDRVLLATDEDREGEAISHFLVDAMQLRSARVPYKRAVFHEITKAAIEESFRSPRDIDAHLVRAQETRRILDKLAGYTLSPVLWRYVGAGMSAGRVQSCGLQLIAEREQERWRFVSSHYYTLHARLSLCDNEHSESFAARLTHIDGRRVADENDFDASTGRPREKDNGSASLLVLDRERASDAARWLCAPDERAGANTESVTYTILDKAERRISRAPPRPLITSSLQQEAAQRLRFSPTRTMSVAQRLYEAGLITYMRTDSPTLSSTAREAAREIVRRSYGEEYLQEENSNKTSSSKTKEKTKENNKKEKEKTAAPKNAQEAHEAIRPATHEGRFLSVNELPPSLPEDERRLYELVYKRTLASVMKSSLSLSTSVVISARETGTHTETQRSALLRASESVLLFPGYSAVHGKTATEAKVFPSTVCVGDRLCLVRDRSAFSQNLAGASTEIDSESDAEMESESETNADTQTETESLLGDVCEGVQCVAHNTHPPARFSEASFVKELETRGVGRPSTYAKVLQVLRDRNYIFIDRGAVIPTVRGLVVAKFLAKEFPFVVDSEFTAKMEKSLDEIARGERDKDSFLHEFYFGDNNNSNGNSNSNNSTVSFPPGAEEKRSKDTTSSGLLTSIVQKMNEDAIDRRAARSLSLPFLSHIGPLSLSKTGLYIENEQSRQTWHLPHSMESDIREITCESVEKITQGELTVEGKVLGESPLDAEHLLALRHGRYGKYLESFDPTQPQSKAKRKFFSLPSWANSSLTLAQAKEMMSLPTTIGTHSQLQQPIEVSLVGGVLSLSVKGLDKRAEVPPGIFLSDLSPSYAEELLTFSELPAIPSNKRALGLWRDLSVTIENGRFGPYLRAGNLFCSLGKLNPETVTLEVAIPLLERKEKKVGSKRVSGATAKKKASSAAKSKKVATKKSSAEAESDVASTETKPKIRVQPTPKPKPTLKPKAKASSTKAKKTKTASKTSPKTKKNKEKVVDEEA